TVNQVPAHGGAISVSGPVITGGMVFISSGYAITSGASGGNLLLAFSVEEANYPQKAEKGKMGSRNLTNSQFSIPNSHPRERRKFAGFPRMRIENWELRIGQIPRPHFPLLWTLSRTIPVIVLCLLALAALTATSPAAAPA